MPKDKKNLANEFLNALGHEEALILRKLKEDNLGLFFITAIKELDYYYFQLMHSGGHTDDTSDHFDVLQLGVPRLLDLAYRARESFDVPILTFKREKALTVAALQLVAHAGFIEAGRRMTHICLAGECEITKLTENSYEFVLPETIENFEQYEKKISHYYRNEGLKMQAKLFSSEQGKKIGKLVNELLDEHVYVWREHFIGYTAHPFLDEYFSTLAYSKIQFMDGFDAFHHSLKFGGITFINYILAATFCLFLSLKHEAFCVALTKRDQKIHLTNILTISGEKSEFIESLMLFINEFGKNFENHESISITQATEICNVLSVNRRNTELLKPTAAPLPYIIQFSDTGLLKSISGGQMVPLQFLLNSLRYHFPKDYDKNQQSREHSMQRAVRRLLLELFPHLIFRDNIKIRDKNATKTDIDLVAIDKRYGTIVLFQLKHQDPYGTDIRARSSRSNRLISQSRKWIDAVQDWISGSQKEQICSTFRLKKGEKIENIRIVILTKYFAHFLSKIGLSEDGAYATWIQFFNALEKLRQQQGDFRTLDGLFSIIKNDMVHKNAKPYDFEGSEEYKLTDLSFSVRQKK